MTVSTFEKCAGYAIQRLPESLVKSKALKEQQTYSHGLMLTLRGRGKNSCVPHHAVHARLMQQEPSVQDVKAARESKVSCTWQFDA